MLGNLLAHYSVYMEGKARAGGAIACKRSLMSRSITAALSKMAMEDRLPLFFRLRKSSLDTRFAAEVRSMYRVAARLVWASFDNAAYDMMYRLQVLEAVHTGDAEDLRWWRRPRQGMKAARDAFEGTNIKEEWLSMGNTGMVSKIEAMIRRGYIASPY